MEAYRRVCLQIEEICYQFHIVKLYVQRYSATLWQKLSDSGLRRSGTIRISNDRAVY